MEGSSAPPSQIRSLTAVLEGVCTVEEYLASSQQSFPHSPKPLSLPKLTIIKLDE
jgi:hypothetical protein